MHGILGQTLRRARREPAMLGGGVVAQVTDTPNTPVSSLILGPSHRPQAAAVRVMHPGCWAVQPSLLGASAGLGVRVWCGPELNDMHAPLATMCHAGTPTACEACFFSSTPAVSGGSLSQMHLLQATGITGEGAKADYQVSSLFARDFIFNQLADHEQVLQLARRRMARKSL